MACSIPLIIILSEECFGNPGLFRFTRKYILPSILLILVIRILMMTDLRFVRYAGFGGKEEKYEVIQSEAHELPVVFTGAFQRPSLYNFFSGNEAVAISSLYSRQTQFDIWQFEKKYHNKPAFICSNPKGNSEIYASDTLQFGGFITDSLQTVNRMRITFKMTEKSFHPGDSVNMSFSLHNPYSYDIDLGHHRFPVQFCMIFLKGEKALAYQVFPQEQVKIVSSNSTINGNISAIIPDLTAGNYPFGLSLNNFFGPSLNSKLVKIKIEDND
jgi:hypothetical protein